MDMGKPDCGPTNHCYHEWKLVNPDKTESIVMVCCDCGASYEGRAANLIKPPRFVWSQ